MGSTGELQRDDVDALYPNALVLLDMQAPHIAERDDVVFIVVNNKRGTTQRKKLHARTSMRDVRIHYDERVGVWVRYSCGVKSYPRRHPQRCDVSPCCDPQRRSEFDVDGEFIGPVQEVELPF